LHEVDFLHIFASMKTEEEYIGIIKSRREQLLKQISSVRKMQEEVDNINSILAIHNGDSANVSSVTVSKKKLGGRFDRQKLLFDCLNGLNGEGTVKNMLAYYMALHPNENEKSIKSMLTQISSALALKGVIGSKSSKEGKGLIYCLKK
jgi:hypothetical protein